MGDGVQMSTTSYDTASGFMRLAVSALPTSHLETSYDAGQATVSRWVESTARWATLILRKAGEQAFSLKCSLETLSVAFAEYDAQLRDLVPLQRPSSDPQPPLAPGPHPNLPWNK